MADNSDLSFLQNKDNPNKVPGEYMIGIKRYAEGANKEEVAEAYAQKLRSLSDKVEVLQKFVLFNQALFHVKCNEAAIVAQMNELPDTEFIEANVCEKMIE